MSDNTLDNKATNPNPIKHTGPLTPEGKKRSSRNALRHGKYAKKTQEFVVRNAALLSNEDRNSYYEIVAAYFQTFRPTSLVARMYVRGMAEDQWRLNRLDDLEAALLDRELHRKAETFVVIFPQLAEVQHLLESAESIAARPALIHMIQRLRREYRLSRRDNFRLLVELNANFPQDGDAKYSFVEEIALLEKGVVNIAPKAA